MTDILKHILVDVHCGHCGDFAIGADVIAESQRMLAEGCPGSPYECPPEVLAPLLEPSALASLERAWADLEATRGGRSRQIAFGEPPHVPVGEPRHVPVDATEQGDAMALDRWENEGGTAPRTQRCAQC